MAKQKYKIPDTLDKMHIDQKVTIQNKDGIGFKVISLRIVIYYLASILVCFWSVSQTFISSAGIALKICFCLLWLLLSISLLSFDKTGLLKLTFIPVMFSYLPKRLRLIVTRTSSKANDFYQLVGVSNIDGNLIEYTNGMFGYMYRVVGGGSRLLFENDQNAILDRVDTFYRKMDVDCEYVFVTTKEAQKVYHQVNSLKYRAKNLSVDDSDLSNLFSMQHDYLANFVGDKFRSIHQYMIIKAPNAEALTMGHNTLRAELETSNLVIRQCTILNEADIIDVLRSVYCGKESV